MAPSVVATSVLAGGPGGAGGAVVVVVVATAKNPAPARTPIRRRLRPIRPPLGHKRTGRCRARAPGGGRMPGMAGRQRISSGSPFEPTIGFSRAVRVGERVVVSGTGPVLPGGGSPEGAEAQARRCFEI